MKTRINTISAILIINAALLITGFNNSNAQKSDDAQQSGLLLTGIVTDSDNAEPVALAHVAFFDASANELLAGTVTDFDGHFSLMLRHRVAGRLRISYIGYETRYLAIAVDVASDGGRNPETAPYYDLGRIHLTPVTLMHDDVVVYGEQVRSRTDADRISWFPHEAMLAAANTGTDVLRFIPGIQVDIMQQVSLDGSHQIIIMVDGVERDRHYVSQLRADRIERIEVMPAPPAAYSAYATGVINIVQKQRRNRDLSGHVHIELPASSNEMYLFPSYSVHFGAGRVGFFTSYSGELSYFDIQDVHTRTYNGNTGTIPGDGFNGYSGEGSGSFIGNIQSQTWQTVQNVRQQNWSHRFNFGIDFQPADGHSMNLFAWVHPWSREHSGDAELRNLTSDGIPWSALKSDDDQNTGRFAAVTYRFSPEGKNGHQITADLSYYALSAKNSTVYRNDESGYYQANIKKPGQQTLHGRLDYEGPDSGPVTIGSGISFRDQLFEDRLPAGFRHSDQTAAAYTTIGVRNGFLDVQAGLRTERVWQSSHSMNGPQGWMWFPNAAASYRFPGATRTLRLAYRRSVQYPHLYQMNPVVHVYDPLYLVAGNTSLRPEIRSTVHLEYSRSHGNSMAALRLYRDRRDQAIQETGFIDESGRFVAQMRNAGDLHRYGVQISGMVSIGTASGIQPMLNVYKNVARPNENAEIQGIPGRTATGWSGGLTAYTTIPGGITASAIIQQAGRDHGLQRSRYSGTLYFVSVEKAFGSSLKAGITSALPFARTFVYDGFEIDQPGYRSRSEGSIMMSAVPVWLKLNYSFSSGIRRQVIARSDDPGYVVPRKGF